MSGPSSTPGTRPAETAPAAPLDTRAALQEIKVHFEATRDKEAHLQWLRGRIKGYTQEQLQQLDEAVGGAAAPSAVLRGVHKELVSKMVRERLDDLKLKATETWDPRTWKSKDTQEKVETGKDVAVAAGGAILGSVLLWKLFQEAKTGGVTGVLTAPFRLAGRGLKYVFTHPVRALGAVALGGVGLFFGASSIERWMQRLGLRHIDAAVRSAGPLGSVAAGETVKDDLATIDTKGIDVPATTTDEDAATKVIGLGGKAVDAAGRPLKEDEERAQLQQKLADAKEKRGAFTLVDAYRLQSLLEQQYGDTQLRKAGGAPDEKTRGLVLASRMRGSYCESIAKSLAQYAQLMKEYENVCALYKGDAPDKVQALRLKVEADNERITGLARRRLAVGFGGAGDPKEIATVESELWNALKVGDDTKGLPVYEATLELLHERYKTLNTSATVPHDALNGDKTVRDMNAALATWFAAQGDDAMAERLRSGSVYVEEDPAGSDSVPAGWKPEWSITGSGPAKPLYDAPLLRYLPSPFPASRSASLKLNARGMQDLFAKAYPGAGAERYAEYVKASRGLKGKEALVADFKTKGSANLGAMMKMQQTMSSFQVDRARLAVISGRAGRKPGATDASPDIWTNPERMPPAEIIRQYEEFQLAQHQDATKRMGLHLQRVENDVLHVGAAEKLEKTWNETGRNMLVRLSFLITTVQTSWLRLSPTDRLPAHLNPRVQAQEALMGSLPDLLGWPRYADGPKKGEHKNWEDCTPAERERMKEKQRSIESEITKFRDAGKEGGAAGPGHFEKMKQSNALVSDMTTGANRATVQGYLNEAAFSDADVDLDAKLSGVRVTSVAEIPAIAAANGCSKAQVVLRCFAQYAEDNAQYQKSYAKMVQGFHDVIGDHLDWSDAFKEFGMKQTEILIGLLALYALGAVAVVWAGPKIAKMTFRAAKAGITGASRLALSAARGAPAATAAPSSAKTLAELARLHKGKPLAELLKAAQEAGHLTPSAAEAIKRSAKAQKIFEGAMKSASAEAEIARAVRIANLAAKLRVLANGLGVAGEAFGIYMAYALYQENGRKIVNTDNEALKDLYRDAQYVNLAEGGICATGLVISGVAMVTTYSATGSVLLAIGAPAGVALLPIVMATVFGSWARGRMDEVTEDLLKEDKDWAKQSESELMGKMAEKRPGQEGYSWWSNSVARDGFWDLKNSMIGNGVTSGLGAVGLVDQEKLEEERYRKVEEANASVSGRILRAYFLRQGAQRAGGEPGEAEWKAKERAAVFANSASRYMAFCGSPQATGLELETAMDYATLSAYSRQLRAAGEEDPIEMSVVDLKATQERDARLKAEGKPPEGVPIFKKITFKLSEFTSLPLSRDTETVKRLAQESKPSAGSVIVEWRKRMREGMATQVTLQGAAAKSSPEEARTSSLATQNLLLSQLHPYIHRMEGLILASSHSDAEKEQLRSTLSSSLRTKLRAAADALMADPALTRETLERAIDDLKTDFRIASDANGRFDGLLGRHDASDGQLERARGTGQTGRLLTADWLSRNLDLPGGARRTAGETYGEQFLKAELGPMKPGGYWEMSTGISFNLNPVFACIDGKWMARWRSSDPWKDPATVVPPSGRGAERATRILEELAKYNGDVRFKREYKEDPAVKRREQAGDTLLGTNWELPWKGGYYEYNPGWRYDFVRISFVEGSWWMQKGEGGSWYQPKNYPDSEKWIDKLKERLQEINEA